MKKKYALLSFVILLILATAINSEEGAKMNTDQPSKCQLILKYTSVIVNDQAAALEFYTNTLGFVKKADIPFGEYRWLTVVSPLHPDGTELALEPNALPASKVFQQAIYEQGIPFTALVVDDIQTEYERLVKLGVVFKSKPTKAGLATVAMFDDNCGNWIQIVQE